MNPPKERHAWVDFAKGICIIGVVSFYAADYLWHEVGSRGWMQHWVDFARPFRMPDFFLISGLFLGRAIKRPWGDYLDKKVVHYLYFFVLWTIIVHGSFQLLLHFGWLPVSIHRGNESVWRWLWEPYAMLWFIHILPIFFLVTRWTQHVPRWLMVLTAAVLKTYPVWGIWGPIGNFCERYVYFYMGYAFAAYVFKLADWAEHRRRLALAGLVLWAVANEWLVHRHLHESKGISLVMGLAGTGAVIVLGVFLSRRPSMNWLRYLGQHSIVTYLGFYVPLVCLMEGLTRWPSHPDIGTSVAIISVVSIATAHALFYFSRDSWARFLFVRPHWLRWKIPPPADVTG